MIIRTERPEDIAAISCLVAAAFEDTAHGSGTEAAIFVALRDSRALTISLVAEEAGDLAGHVAFSPVTVDGKDIAWFGLGPVAVLPSKQWRGIGTALIETGLEQLRTMGARGCVVLGDPAYYRKFGFECDDALRYPDAPGDYFQRIIFEGAPPSGVVAYHSAFGI